MRQAARMLGLKLILLAVSFGAIASAMPAEVPLSEATWGGMKLLHLVLGTMGAGASLFFLPQFTARSLGATVACGVLCALGGTPAAAWAIEAYLKAPFPRPLENAVAIALGVGGVYIIPTCLRLWAWFKANPLGVISWVRGGGRIPPEPGDLPEDKGARP